MSRIETKRRGFTLLELLVVLAIIGILASLTAAAVFRLRDSRDTVTTDETLQKLESARAIQYKNAIDRIKKEQPSFTVIGWTNHDMALAKVVHLKLRMRGEFPDNVNELNPLTLFPGADAVSVAMRADPAYRPKGAYLQAQVVADLTSLPSDDDRNAALLALVLGQARGGSMFDTDQGAGANATTTFPGTSLRHFRDGWGRPIYFRRSPDANREPFLASIVTELNEAPYVDMNKPISATHSWDPLDPENLLARNPTAKALLDQWLGQVNNGYNRPLILFSQGRRPGINNDELYNFRLQGFGKGS